MPDSKLQAAAIPVRGGRVCLVPSRSGRRWVVPKGMIDAGHTPQQTATVEAWEEAGLRGALVTDPVGEFKYTKGGREHVVTVFVLHVTSEADRWPEMHERQRIWLTPDEAADRLDEPELKDMVRRVADLVAVA
jgi:8-oxo-dGTP pyrophosphatase MutT (NUDIX family)